MNLPQEYYPVFPETIMQGKTFSFSSCLYLYTNALTKNVKSQFMKYREHLLNLILNENEEALIEWIQKQPLLNQPEIFRELKALSEEIMEELSDGIPEEGNSFEEDINNY